jgi:hypothetical protein
VLEAEAVTDELHERAVAAQGMAKAARVLAGPQGGYTLVLTNVPYLGRGSQSDLLKEFADAHCKEAKADLATIFVSRMLRWVGSGKDGERTGTLAAVTPQNWLFLTSYRKLRERLLKERSWEIVVRLGPGAFETIGGHVVNVALLAISGVKAGQGHLMAGVDVSAASPAAAKAALLRGEDAADTRPQAASALEPTGPSANDEPDDAVPAGGSVQLVRQADQLENPGTRILFAQATEASQVKEHALPAEGLSTGDGECYVQHFWEHPETAETWHMFQTSPDSDGEFDGQNQLLRWEENGRLLAASAGARVQGDPAWGRPGILIARVSSLRVCLYSGEKFEKSCVVVSPRNADDLPALWAFASSQEFIPSVRSLDTKPYVTTAVFGSLPFDLARWKSIAAEKYPNGLPEPQSDDPTQWLFHGHPAHAEPHSVLQVAVARLVGYRWPAELDEDMRLAPEARALVRRCSELTQHADDDGIVCLSSIQGEGSAADRLRSLLALAFGADWSAAQEQDLLRAAGERFHKGKVQRSLEDWLRDRFFEEHCAHFHSRPFVWHVWDGLPDGFHALVNYHRLAGANGEGRKSLEKLASTYLGEWIERQRQLSAASEEGADGRLAAALALQAELRKILAGEPPYDIFVRWKPLHEQPIGWDPDINDGVRLNIRPFLMAQDVRAKNAGILRAKPDNTWCNAKKLGVKDRGKESESRRPRQHFPWFWGCDPEQHREHRVDFGAGTPDSAPAGKTFDGARWNGLHYSLAAKQAARKERES